MNAAGPSLTDLLIGALRWLAIIVMMIIVLFPIYWMLVSAFTPTGFSRQILGFVPPEFTLRNFVLLATERPMLRWLWNSVVVATLAALISLLVGMSCGYALSRLRFRGSYLVMVCVLASQMIPSTSILVPMYSMFRELGLLDTIHGVVLGHISLALPLAIWMSKGFFDSIPSDLEGAARIDGCSQLSAFWYVAMPLATPGMVGIFVYGFVTSWHDYVFPKHFVTTQDLWTAAAGITSFRGEYFTLFEPQLAAALLFAMPVVILFFILQRRIVSEGLAGGIK